MKKITEINVRWKDGSENGTETFTLEQLECSDIKTWTSLHYGDQKERLQKLLNSFPGNRKVDSW